MLNKMSWAWVVPNDSGIHLFYFSKSSIFLPPKKNPHTHTHTFIFVLKRGDILYFIVKEPSVDLFI